MARRKTVTGQTIHEIALSLKKADPSLSFEEAKKQAKPIVQAKEAHEKEVANARELLETGGKFKSKILRSIFGDFLGKKLSKALTSKSAEERASRLILGHDTEQQQTTAQSLSNLPIRRRKKDPLTEILSRLDRIEKDLKQIRGERIAAPKPAEQKNPLTAEKAEAHAGLAALGFKKEEIEKMTAGAPEGASKEEIIKHALTGGKSSAARVPRAEAPSAAAEAIREIQTPAAPTAVPHVQSDVGDEQKMAKELRGEEDKQAETKENVKWKKEVVKDLEEIKENEGKSHGLLDTLLGAVLLLAPKIGEKIGEWASNYFNKQDPAKVKQNIRSLGFATSEEEAIKMGRLSWNEVNKDGEIVQSHMLTGTAKTQALAAQAVLHPEVAKQKAAAAARVIPQGTKSTDKSNQLVREAGQPIADTQKDGVINHLTGSVAALSEALAKRPIPVAVGNQGSDDPAVITIRNTDPTIAGSTSMFDNPAAWSGTMRM